MSTARSGAHQQGCNKDPSCLAWRGPRSESCVENMPSKEYDVDLTSKKCAHLGFAASSRISAYVAGAKKGEFRTDHAKDGMVNLSSMKCANRGCTKPPSYGVAGGIKREGMQNTVLQPIDKRRLYSYCRSNIIFICFNQRRKYTARPGEKGKRTPQVAHRHRRHTAVSAGNCPRSADVSNEHAQITAKPLAHAKPCPNTPCPRG